MLIVSVVTTAWWRGYTAPDMEGSWKMLNKELSLANKERSSCLGFGRELTAIIVKIWHDMKRYAGSCEEGIECFGSIKGGELLDQLNNY
jgi:hypothetical protein